MIEKIVSKTDNGINIKFIGMEDNSKIKSMLSECEGGNCSCDCDPSLVEKIEGISFSEDSNNDLTVSLTSSSLEVPEIEDTVKHCDFN